MNPPPRAGERDRAERFYGEGNEEALVGLNVLVSVSLVFLCFLSVAKSTPSVLTFVLA